MRLSVAFGAACVTMSALAADQAPRQLVVTRQDILTLLPLYVLDAGEVRHDDALFACHAEAIRLAPGLTLQCIPNACDDKTAGPRLAIADSRGGDQVSTSRRFTYAEREYLLQELPRAGGHAGREPVASERGTIERDVHEALRRRFRGKLKSIQVEGSEMKILAEVRSPWEGLLVLLPVVVPGADGRPVEWASLVAAEKGRKATVRALSLEQHVVPLDMREPGVGVRSAAAVLSPTLTVFVVDQAGRLSESAPRCATSLGRVVP